MTITTNFKQLLFLASFALFAMNMAWGHGDPVAKRGGILQVIDELDFELQLITRFYRLLKAGIIDSNKIIK